MSGGGAAVGRMRGDYGDWKRVYRYAFRYRPLNKQIFDTATDLYEVKVQKQQAELSYLLQPGLIRISFIIPWRYFGKRRWKRMRPELAQDGGGYGKYFPLQYKRGVHSPASG